MFISFCRILLGWLISLRKQNVCFDLPLYHLHFNVSQQSQKRLKSKHCGSDTQAVFGLSCGPNGTWSSLKWDIWHTQAAPDFHSLGFHYTPSFFIPSSMLIALQPWAMPLSCPWLVPCDCWFIHLPCSPENQPAFDHRIQQCPVMVEKSTSPPVALAYRKKK